MTENEQIEEMAAVIQIGLILSASPKIIAEALYEANGYRRGERGEWEIAIGYDPNKKVKCSVCNLMDYEPRAFCPHCGAEMRSNEDDKKRKDQLL